MPVGVLSSIAVAVVTPAVVPFVICVTECVSAGVSMSLNAVTFAILALAKSLLIVKMQPICLN